MRQSLPSPAGVTPIIICASMIGSVSHSSRSGGPIKNLDLVCLLTLLVLEPTECHVGQNLCWWSLVFYPFGVDDGPSASHHDLTRTYHADANTAIIR